MKIMKKGRITLIDVAKDAKVSIATVSAVINGSSPVSEKVRKRVNNSIKKLNYTVDGIARSLKIRKTNTIGLLISNIRNTFYTEVVGGAEDYLIRNNYNLILCNTDYDELKEKSYLKILAEKRVDGLIISSLSRSNCKELGKLINAGIGVVFVDKQPYRYSSKISTVTTNDFLGSYLATKHLMEHGYKEIAFFGFSEKIQSIEGRIEGYKKALIDNNRKVQDDLIINSGLHINPPYEEAMKFLKRKKLPRSVVAANNLIAKALISCAHKLKIKIPEDIALISFGDFDMAPFINPPVTVVYQPNIEMGRKASEILLEEINKEKGVKKKQAKHVLLDVKLIIRRSCGCNFEN